MDDVTLREYLEALLAELGRRLDERAENLEERLTLLNELRGNVLSRDEYNARHDGLITTIERNRDEFAKRFGALENWRANLMGRAVAIGLVGAIIVATVAALFTHLAAG